MSVIAPPAEQPKTQLFSMKVVLALILVGVFSFSAFLTLNTFAPDLTSGDDGRAHALSRSSIGFAGAIELARLQGMDASVSRTPFANLNRSALFVLAPESPLSLEQLDPLKTERVLIILPKWSAGDKPGHPGWVLRGGPFPPQIGGMMLGDVVTGAELTRASGKATPALHFAANALIGPEGETLTPGEIDQLQTISGKGLVPVIAAADGSAVLARVGDRPLYILADPDFLNTQGIADINTARVGMRILSSLDDAHAPILFDVTLNGFARDRSLLRLAFEPPFLAATLTLLAVALLLAWRSISRSSPNLREERSIALGKRALAENSAALVRLGKREHKMGKGYAALTREATLELIGMNRGESEEATALLDRVGESQNVSSRFSDLEKEASEAKTPAQMLTAARRLHLWKEEMLRATR